MNDEILVHNTLEGKVCLESIRRPSMKLNQRPRIVVCLPIGTKPKANVFKTPDGEQWMAPAVSVPATVPIQWVMAHMRMVPPLGTNVSYLSHWGLLSGEARQIMTTRALQIVQDDGYILYWDDDVIVEPLSLYTLYNFMEQNPDAGLVTGVYSTRQDPTEPVLYKEHMKGAHWGVTVGPEAKPEEIFGCGAGFMLVRVTAIRNMIENNPGVPIWADSKSVPLPDAQADGHIRFTTTWGHDLRFCRLMAEAGWKLYVDGRVELGHFDITEQREYRLPDDSPPKRRGRKSASKMAGTIMLVLPTHNDLEYAAKAIASFKAHAGDLTPMVCVIDDASDGVTDETYAEWAKANGADQFKRFPDGAGMTRSWNYGLQVAREMGAEFAVCGNADTIFSPGWAIGIVDALKDHELVGPVTNAPGWGCDRQNIRAYTDREFDDSPETIAAIAADIVAQPFVTLSPISVSYGQNQMNVTIPEFLNGFCIVARTETWFAGAFDGTSVFDPSRINSENETELQMRWTVGQGARRAIVPSSFVFHYRSVSRGDQHMCDGAYRPVAAGSCE